MDYIRLDLAGQAIEVPTLEHAEYIAIDLHMQLVQRYEDLEALNRRLHGKLVREVQAKKKYRERLEKAAVLGKRPTRSHPKREIVSRRDGFYEVHLVDLDAQTAEEALAEAMWYLREEMSYGRLHRITDPGTGCWQAEVEVLMPPVGGAPLHEDKGRPR